MVVQVYEDRCCKADQFAGNAFAGGMAEERRSVERDLDEAKDSKEQ